MGLVQPGRETRPYFNIKEYGATGDGSTDDYAAVAAAFSAAAAAGGSVYVPAGTYLIGTRIVLSNGVSVYGDGEASWLKGPVSFGGEQLIESLKIGRDGYGTQHVTDIGGLLVRRCRFCGGGGSPVLDNAVISFGENAGDCQAVFEDCLFECNAAANRNVVSIMERTGTVDSAHLDLAFVRCHFGVDNGVRSGSTGFLVEATTRNYDSNESLNGFDLLFRDCVFEAADGITLDFEAGNIVDGYDTQDKQGKVVVDGCLIKGGGRSDASPYRYGVVFEGPVNAVFTNNTVWTCPSRGMMWRVGDNCSPRTAIVSGNVFDFTRTSEVSALQADCCIIGINDANGILFSGNTFRLDNDIYTTNKVDSVVQVYGSPDWPAADITFDGNYVADMSTFGGGARFLDVVYSRRLTLSGNVVETRGMTLGSFIYDNYEESSELTIRNNTIRSLALANNKSMVVRPIFAGPGIRKTYRVARFHNLAANSNTAIVNAETNPAPYSKTAAATDHLGSAAKIDNLLRFTASGSVAVNDVLKDQAADEYVRVLSVDGETVVVERGYGIWPPVAHSAGATWSLVGQHRVPVNQPSECRRLTLTGSAAGQNGLVIVFGYGGFGQRQVETLATPGSGTDVFVFAYSRLDGYLLPVRNAAGNTISIGVTGHFGLPEPFSDNADVLFLEVMAATASEFTRQAAGSTDYRYQTTAYTPTAGDTLAVHYLAIQ